MRFLYLFTICVCTLCVQPPEVMGQMCGRICRQMPCSEWDELNSICKGSKNTYSNWTECLPTIWRWINEFIRMRCVDITRVFRLLLEHLPGLAVGCDNWLYSQIRIRCWRVITKSQTRFIKETWCRVDFRGDLVAARHREWLLKTCLMRAVMWSTFAAQVQRLESAFRGSSSTNAI